MKLNTKKEIVKVEGKLRELVTVHDEKGKILHKILSPLMIEFKFRDILQVIIGASILAIPVAFTEETWNMGQNLPLINVVGLMLISLLFISLFVYYNYYRRTFSTHWKEFLKRVLSTYIFSFLVVGMILFLIQKTPWTTDWILAFKRIVLVAFPASMSAAVADMIK